MKLPLSCAATYDAATCAFSGGFSSAVVMQHFPSAQLLN